MASYFGKQVKYIAQSIDISCVSMSFCVEVSITKSENTSGYCSTGAYQADISNTYCTFSYQLPITSRRIQSTEKQPGQNCRVYLNF